MPSPMRTPLRFDILFSVMNETIFDDNQQVARVVTNEIHMKAL